MKKAASAAKIHETDGLQGELAELGEECAHVLLLLQRLAKARAQHREYGEILGELSASVLHLHAHTKGLDDLIDGLTAE